MTEIIAIIKGALDKYNVHHPPTFSKKNGISIPLEVLA